MATLTRSGWPSGPSAWTDLTADTSPCLRSTGTAQSASPTLYSTPTRLGARSSTTCTSSALFSEAVLELSS